MPRRLSPREVSSVLTKEGFIFVSQRGSHVKYRKVSNRRTLTVIVPMGKPEIPPGTLQSIMRQSKLPKGKFFD